MKFKKIRPVGAERIHKDGRTDITKPTGAFRDFANAPKNPHLCKELNSNGPNQSLTSNFTATSTCTAIDSSFVSRTCSCSTRLAELGNMDCLKQTSTTTSFNFLSSPLNTPYLIYDLATKERLKSK
jgi:hypothetical protein